MCAIISAGCVAGSGTVPAATSPIPAETTTAAVTTTTPPVSMASLTEIKTTMAAPKTTETTAAPAKPLTSEIILTGVGSDFTSFTTQKPGKISIVYSYSKSLGGPLPNCKEGDPVAKLSGSSFDAVIPKPVAFTPVKENIYNLISPGAYKIQVSGACYGWKFTIDNAE